MNFRIKTGLLARLFFIIPALAVSCEKGNDETSSDSGEILTFQEPHMGTLFTIRIWVPKNELNRVPSGTQQGTIADCTLLSQRAFDRVAKLNRIFSDYLVESEVSQLSKAPANQAIPVSDELFDILQQGQKLSELSDGAFDVTIGPMVRLWRRVRKSRELPTDVQIAGAKARTGFEKLVLDPKAKTVTKTVDQMVIDLGGIAKGYAADEALRILKQGGYPVALVAASGDIALGDPPPGKKGWSVGLETLEMAAPGEAGFELANAAVSTSGDTRRFLLINGQRYSHIVDKQTGLGLTDRIAVSVIAPDATTSDSYATAVSILGKERGMQLIESTPGIEGRLVTVDAEGKAKVYFSSGYPGEKPKNHK
jgi:thiamine biosynthesis lipoprotein